MIHLGDICKINGAEIEPVWVVTGGSPCQDLSIAGKRAGLAGAQSGLFMEQVRIVKEMREADKRNGRTGDMVRPRFLVWENVVGAFSSNRGKDFAAVLEEIARIAEPGFSLSGLPEKWKWTKAGAIDGDGWSIAWRTHDAKDWGKTIRDSRTGDVIRLGTPQRRRRISVVADFGGESAAQIQFDRESVSGHPAESGAAGEGSAETAESGAGRTGESIAQAYGETGVGYWQNGVQTLRAEGENRPSRPSNVVVCSTGNDQTIFCMATQQGGAELRTDDRAPTLTAAAGMSGNNQPVVCLKGNAIDRDTAQNGAWSQEDVCYTLDATDRPAVCAYSFDSLASNSMKSKNPNSGCRETEITKTLDTTNPDPSKNQGGIAVVALDMTHACDVICECGEQVPALQARMGTGGNQVPLTYQMNGFGDYRAAEVASSCKQRDFKDGTDLVCSSVDCRNFREGGEVNGTLQAKESGGQSLNLNNTVRQNMVVRRLTPMECTRLQGYPDGWVDIGDWTDEKGKKHKDADSPKYKALGNSIALPFWDWMLRRMARYLPEGATLGSLFDGIGGFPLIWERIHGKGTARWASEIEPFPIAVTKKHFPEEE